MRAYKVFVLSALLCAYAMISCATKRQWQGNYITVSYSTIMPKEDFKVPSYVVVAYNVREVNKYSGVVYRFDVMKGDKKIGALEVCDRSSEDPRLSMVQADIEYKYYLLAGDTESAHNYSFGLGFATRQIHRMYKDIPDYETVKADVIDVLSH